MSKKHWSEQDDDYKFTDKEKMEILRGGWDMRVKIACSASTLKFLHKEPTAELIRILPDLYLPGMSLPVKSHAIINCITDFCEGQGLPYLFPPRDEILKRCREQEHTPMGKSTLIRHLALLETAGWIKLDAHHEIVGFGWPTALPTVQEILARERAMSADCQEEIEREKRDENYIDHS